MEGGMFVSKYIHLDEQACSGHLMFRATFSPWGLHAHLLESRVASSIRVVRGGRAGTPSSPYFCYLAPIRLANAAARLAKKSGGLLRSTQARRKEDGKGSHALQSPITGGQINN